MIDEPRKPKSFGCVSQNWENMLCSWVPEENYITTKYIVLFKLPGRAGRQRLYPCPKENKDPNSCLWDSTTNPIYRQPYARFTLILNAQNALGNASFSYKFDHFAHGM